VKLDPDLRLGDAETMAAHAALTAWDQAFLRSRYATE